MAIVASTAVSSSSLVQCFLAIIDRRLTIFPSQSRFDKATFPFPHLPTCYLRSSNNNGVTNITPCFPRRTLAAAGTDDEEEDDEEYAEYSDGTDDGLETTNSASNPATNPPNSGRLYAGNLPFSMTPSQLKDVFSQAGSVENVEVVYDRVTDRSRGFAFVTMSSFEAANAAIQMFDGAQLGGRSVKVNFPEVPRGGERAVVGSRIRSGTRGFIDSPYKVYAGNLAWSVTSETLGLVFGEQTGLLGARVIYERDTGRSKGYGFVSFDSSENAQSAIDAINAKELEGRPLRLSIAAEKRPTLNLK